MSQHSLTCSFLISLLAGALCLVGWILEFMLQFVLVVKSLSLPPYVLVVALELWWESPGDVVVDGPSATGAGMDSDEFVRYKTRRMIAKLASARDEFWSSRFPWYTTEVHNKINEVLKEFHELDEKFLSLPDPLLDRPWFSADRRS